MVKVDERLGFDVVFLLQEADLLRGALRHLVDRGILQNLTEQRRQRRELAHLPQTSHTLGGELDECRAA
eukprot:CAMPEP_0170320238 /NCGR_PEP_ID=MMETSP0116_2-20130129/60849_1 /TAXON_ID=400756 /ORGANISM="Durinskia baltica, Strain CSIRO CS-38" /LENGTH=68 /DNA_ID=CAMNT_0010573001 /DNA_START=24 /DNA_END=226 /DNA_ORIENTATION=-